VHVDQIPVAMVSFMPISKPTGEYVAASFATA
jgi:hypothetical protein